ncbi:RES family NAD+ phosphorylase [Spirosoma profusum]|uniref:RES family NAD+ phosphorylase n=1 Tax=Spirosoma profusum TaxID=2771354 RepID=UPI001CC243FF|nr:RES family NAD+ phosphorylase [Spirosoma profusum]
MDVYRINKEPCHTEPLSVAGSYRQGGRWNPKGVEILYTSRTPELALLGTLIHLPPVSLCELPQLWLTTLRLPDLPDTVFWLKSTLLPTYWKTGTLAETQTILTEWLNDPFSLAIAVPSVIMEVSYNLLLHRSTQPMNKLRSLAR